MAKPAPFGITAVPGIEVGHATDLAGITGCTVVLCRAGAVGGVDVRGSAPGTRETDLLRSENLVEKVHAVVLTGGSAFGLDAACGVMHYLEEQGIGYETGAARVPIVPAAVLYDLAIGDPQARPTAEMGYAAARAASAEEAREGNVGAGTGASVGKLFGMGRAMKGGLGLGLARAGGILVGAVVAVNPLGDVVNPNTGEVIAGLRSPSGERVASSKEAMKGLVGRAAMGFAGNTVIGVVATNAGLTKAQANKVAQMAQDGIARAVQPAHTMFDGDTIFVLSAGRRKAPVTLVGALATEAVAQAIVRGVLAAEGLGGLPAARDMGTAGPTLRSP
ncbi:MAG: P1 family peptidase [Anaerolineae bacterium]